MSRFSRARRSISGGNSHMATRKDTVEDVVRALPCALKAHYPLSISRVESDGGVAIYGSVRTTSDHWDGCGGRTDLHEVLAALWAAILRTNGVASSRLIDMEGMCGSPEVYQRWLVFDQPFGGVFQRRVHERHWKQLLAHTAWAYHAIADAIGMKPPSVRQPSWHEDAEPSWLGALRALVEVKGEELWVSRENPDWQYYTAGENAVSVVELRPGAALRLRASVGQYNPTVVRIGENEVLRAGDMVTPSRLDSCAWEAGLCNALREARVCHGKDWARPPAIGRQSRYHWSRIAFFLVVARLLC